MILITKNALDPMSMYDRIQKSKAGSVLFHYAVVKGQTGEKSSAGIHLEKNGDMKEELTALSADIRQRWHIEDVLIARRTGTLNVGDIISLVAVSSPSSVDAFEACRYGLEKLKRMKTIKKTEKIIG